MIKVTKGTRSGENLCRTCRNSTIFKGARESHEVILCSYLRGRPNNAVPFDVVECSSYEDKNQVGLEYMERTAWILETSKDKRQVGFVPMKEWEKNHENEEVTPPHKERY